MTGPAYQTTDYKVVISAITERSIIVNLSDDCFFIPESFDPERTRRVVAEVCNDFGRIQSNVPSKLLRPFFTAFNAVTSAVDLGEAVNAIMTRAIPRCNRFDKARITDLLLARLIRRGHDFGLADVA